MGSKVCMILILIVALRHTEGWKKHNDGSPKAGSKRIHKELLNLKQEIDRIVKIYSQEHSILVQSDQIPSKKNIAVTCRRKVIKDKMSVKYRAKVILDITQMMVNHLQQMQIDESRLPSGSHDLASNLRHLEFDLRNVAELMYETKMKKIISRMSVEYSVGNLPSSPSPYCCRPKTVRAVNVLQLRMLQSCLSDIDYALRKKLNFLNK